jgi:hypothetical protein
LAREKKIFISHSSKDRAYANDLCAKIECNQLKCWIAPRDIPIGARYASEIIKAVKSCGVLILVFTQHANSSYAVASEVESAFSLGIPILPLRIHDIDPNDELLFYIKATQWLDAFSSDQREIFNELISNLRSHLNPEMAGQPIITSYKNRKIYTVFKERYALPQDTSLSHLINDTIYPFASAFNDIKEQEIKDNKDGIHIGIFKLIDLFIRYATFSLLAAYRALPYHEYMDKDIKMILYISNASTKKWLEILAYLVNVMSKREAIPKFIHCFIRFWLKEQPKNSLIHQNYQFIYEALRGRLDSPKGGIKLYNFLELMLEYHQKYSQDELKISDAARRIKESFIEIFTHNRPFFELNLLGIKSVTPNKEEGTIEYVQIEYNGPLAKEKKNTLITSEHEVYNAGDVLLITIDNSKNRLNLSPFLQTSKDFSDLLVWRSCENFVNVTYESISNRIIKNYRLNKLDPFLEKCIRIFYQFEKRAMDEEGKSSAEHVHSRLKHVREYAKKEVSNPLYKQELEIRFNKLHSLIETSILTNSPSQLPVCLSELEDIIIYIKKSTFCKLKPTSNKYILSDENNGRYIIPGEFLKTNSFKKIENDFIMQFLGKKATEAVIVMIFLAFTEAGRRSTNRQVGVGHLMIALSKIAEKLVFDWYSALGISPSLHRNLIREAIAYSKDDMAVSAFNKLKFKPRLKHVINMAIEEVNLDKREKLEITDILSAILREGQSTPVRIMTSVFNLSRDRILGEFYDLLKLR